KPIDELGLFVGPKEEIDCREALAKPIALGLTDRAAGQDDAHPGIGRLEPLEDALAADHLLLRGLADRAGVDHDDVRGLHRWRLGAARGEETAGHLLRVAPGHLAAE